MIVTTKTSRLRTALLGSAGLVAASAALAFSAPAFAQQQTAQAQTAQAELGETIIVTGSRIARPDLESATPIAVVSSEELALKGAVNVEALINDLPQFLPSGTAYSNNPGGGVATIDLRGIGPQRTLVLVNSRRYVYYDPNQIVDLNSIPSALIERIETVTGGRSAVYGSDAIAGVVNFVLKKNFEGAELNAQYALTQRGDGTTYNFDATFGSNFADGKGNVTFHAGYLRRHSVLQGARDFSRFTVTDDADSTDAVATSGLGGSSSIEGTRLAVAGLNAALGFASGQVRFNPNGTAVRYNNATDQYNFAPDNFLQVPQERWLINTTARYEVNDHLKFFAEGTFINNRVDAQLAPTPFTEQSARINVHVNSPYLSPAVQAALQALDAAETGTDQNDGYVSAAARRRLTELGPRINQDERNAYRVLFGFEGDIVGDWKYETSYLFSRTRNSQRQTGNVAVSRFVAATQTVFLAPDGVTTSVTPVAGYTLACADAGARAAGCVPANIYGAGNITEEAARYLRVDATNLESAQTQVASIVVNNGNLFDLGLGAGPAGIALGYEWRSEAASYAPDTYLAAGDVAGFNAGEPTQGRYSLTELYGELVVPILKDVPFAKLLEVNGALRWSNYSNDVDSVWTYAFGGQWKPIEDITVRGQFQRAIRGPSVQELFQGTAIGFPSATDPCEAASAATDPRVRALCIATGVPAADVGTEISGNAQQPATFGGVRTLREETSDTYTIGAIIQPRFIPRLNFSIDYYNIKIDNFISPVGAANILSLCYTYSVQRYCDAITRDADGAITDITNFRTNAGGLQTEGLDFAIDYSFTVGWAPFGLGESKINLRYNGTYLLNYDFRPDAQESLVNDCEGRYGNICGEPLPQWRHSFRGTVTMGPLTTSLLWRLVGSSRDDDDANLYFRESYKTASYFDLTMSYEFNEHFDFTFGIGNLFDNTPPVGGDGNSQQANTYPNTYEPLGRRFFLSAKAKF